MRALVARSPWLRLAALVCAGSALGLLSTCSPGITVIEQVGALGVLRVATVNSPTTYYEGPAGATGFEYDLALDFARQLGVELELVVADSTAEAIEKVKSGRVHLAAAGLSVTPLRSQALRFTQPILRVVPQLVYRMGARRPETPAQIEGKLVVAQHSAGAELLARLRQHNGGLSWVEEPDTDTEELLLRVANGEIDYTVSPSDLVAINQRYFPQLRVAFDVAEPQDVAWALTPGRDSSLYDAAQRFLGGMSETELARLRDRYFGHVEQVGYLGAVALAAHVETRLPKYRRWFENAAREYDLDWRLLAAIGYQESHWDPSAVSVTGVRGIMQLTMQTARFLGVANREDPAQSIMGGARYLRRLLDLIPAEVQEPDRTWLALSAYNMGFGHLADVRELTRRRGGDPARWLDVRANLPLLTQTRWHRTLKHGYARGHEAKTFVGNVRTYQDMLLYLFADPPKPSLPAKVSPPAPIEPVDPLNIRTPVL